MMVIMDSTRPAPAHKQLEAWLQYFDDLGIGSFYRDREARSQSKSVDGASIAEAAAAVDTQPSVAASDGPALPTLSQQGNEKALAVLPNGPPVARVADEPQHTLPPDLRALVHPPPLLRFDEPVHETLESIGADLGDCTRCKLHRKRHKIVFGAGNPAAELVFVGEGPGHDEDMQGLPFVGRAGKLLTQMIEAMSLTRDDVYIANIVKCRPPENRTPQEDEIATCMPFLERQLGAIKPKIIVCLGSTAAQTLLGTKKSISAFRGQWFDYQGAKLISTYHPAYLLRNPAAKSDVWIDLKKVMAALGLKPPARDASRPRV
jgi:uracil-DNA glycosylase